MSLKSKRVMIIFLAQIFIFRFYFDFISTAFQQFILFGLIGLYIVFNFERLVLYFTDIGKYKTLFLVANLFYFALVISTFFTPLLYKTYDMSYFSVHVRYFSYILSYIVLLDVIKNYLEYDNLKDEFLRIFIAASRNYVIVTIIMLIFPGIKRFWQQIIMVNPRNMELINTNPSYIARFGWAGYSGFSITFLCALGVAFCTYLIVKDIQKGSKIHMNYIVSLMFLILGNAFYGRVGLMNSLVLVTIATAYIIIKNKKIDYAMYLITTILLFFIILFVARQTNETLASWYNWIMEPIINILTTGSFNTTSTDALWDMYFVPEVQTLIFGDGFYTSPTGDSYYMSVDVGYLRPVLFYGVFMLLLSYLIPILMAWGIGMNEKYNRFLSFTLLFTLFVFEVKGEVIIPLMSIIYILFLAEMATTNTKNVIAERFQPNHMLKANKSVEIQ